MSSDIHGLGERGICERSKIVFSIGCGKAKMVMTFLNFGYLSILANLSNSSIRFSVLDDDIPPIKALLISRKMLNIRWLPMPHCTSFVAHGGHYE